MSGTFSCSLESWRQISSMKHTTVIRDKIILKCIHARCFVRCYKAHYVREVSSLWCCLRSTCSCYRGCVFCTVHTRNALSTAAIVNSQEIPWCDCTKQIMVHKCVRGLWATGSILESRITSRWQMLTDENRTQWTLYWRHQDDRWLDLRTECSVSASSARNANKLLPFPPCKNYGSRNLQHTMKHDWVLWNGTFMGYLMENRPYIRAVWLWSLVYLSGRELST